MFLQLALISTPAAVFAKTASKSSGVGFYVVLLVLVAVYFFYLRPRRQKLLARQAAAKGDGPTEIKAGDTVLTTSGIIGRVLSIDGDRASVEIAPDTVVEIHRSALGRRLDPEAPDEGNRWASLVDGEHDPTDAAESTPDTPDTPDTSAAPGETGEDPHPGDDKHGGAH
jgi:preprotein translocase subunit YajC